MDECDALLCQTCAALRSDVARPPERKRKRDRDGKREMYVKENHPGKGMAPRVQWDSTVTVLNWSRNFAIVSTLRQVEIHTSFVNIFFFAGVGIKINGAIFLFIAVHCRTLGSLNCFDAPKQFYRLSHKTNG